jgi:hypothetical protein
LVPEAQNVRKKPVAGRSVTPEFCVQAPLAATVCLSDLLLPADEAPAVVCEPAMEMGSLQSPLRPGEGHLTELDQLLVHPDPMPGVFQCDAVLLPR